MVGVGSKVRACGKIAQTVELVMSVFVCGVNVHV